MVQSINEIVHALSNASAPANTAWVELFPALLSLPESLASWKRRGRQQFVKFSATYKGLVDGVREKVVSISLSRCAIFRRLTIH